MTLALTPSASVGIVLIELSPKGMGFTDWNDKKEKNEAREKIRNFIQSQITKIQKSGVTCGRFKVCCTACPVPKQWHMSSKYFDLPPVRKDTRNPDAFNRYIRDRKTIANSFAEHAKSKVHREVSGCIALKFFCMI